MSFSAKKIYRCVLYFVKEKYNVDLHKKHITLFYAYKRSSLLIPIFYSFQSLDTDLGRLLSQKRYSVVTNPKIQENICSCVCCTLHFCWEYQSFCLIFLLKVLCSLLLFGVPCVFVVPSTYTKHPFIFKKERLWCKRSNSMEAAKNTKYYSMGLHYYSGICNINCKERKQQ